MKDRRKQLSSKIEQLEGDIFLDIFHLSVSPGFGFVFTLPIAYLASNLSFSFSIFLNLMLLGIVLSHIYWLISLWPGLRAKFRTQKNLKDELESLNPNNLNFIQKTKPKKRNYYDIEDELRQVEKTIPINRLYRNFLLILIMLSFIRAVMYPSGVNFLLVAGAITHSSIIYLGIYLVFREKTKQREDLKQELQALENETSQEISDIAADEWYNDLESKKKKMEEL